MTNSSDYLLTTNTTSWSGDDNETFQGIDWDDWDLSFWTPEQRQLLERGEIPRQVYITLGILLTLIVLFGFTANSTILYVFSRFKRLRTPANVFIINLTICDFLSCCMHPLAVYSAFRGRWSFGQTACNLYGMGICFFGLNTIVTLSAIACERYIVITSSSCRPAVAKWRITRRQAQKICVGIWIHCAALVTPPWLFEWSSYGPEGVLVTCSWDYTTRTLSNRLYYFYLLFFGFFLPVSVLTYCYAAIFRFIVRSSREITRLIMTSDGTTSFSKSTVSFRKRRRQTDVRTALIILSLAVLCFTAWTPYTIVSLMGQFGPVDEDGQPRKLSPMATAIPAFLAKTAIVFDPLVYGFSSPQFRNSVHQILRQHSMSVSGNDRNRTGPNNMEMKTRSATPFSRSPRVSSYGTRSSYSRSTKMIAKEPLPNETLNDLSVSTSLVVPQCSRLPTDTDLGSNDRRFGRGGSARKSCMKRKRNSLIIQHKVQVTVSHHFSMKDVSTTTTACQRSSTLPQMILQNKGKFYLLHQKPISSELEAGEIHSQGNRHKTDKRNQKSSSETDLIHGCGKCSPNLKTLPVSASFGQ